MAAAALQAPWLLGLGGCGRSAAPPEAPAVAAGTPQKAPANANMAHADSAAAPAPAASVAPAPVASTASATAIEVVRLALGTGVDAAHKITAPGTRFAPDDKMLYASVDTRGQTAKATLDARWRYLEGDGQLISSISQSIAADGPATTTFTLHNPDLWPEGSYRVEIYLDGKPVGQRDFEIAKP